MDRQAAGTSPHPQAEKQGWSLREAHDALHMRCVRTFASAHKYKGRAEKSLFTSLVEFQRISIDLNVAHR